MVMAFDRALRMYNDYNNKQRIKLVIPRSGLSTALDVAIFECHLSTNNTRSKAFTSTIMTFI